jgi:hypothetical protein
VSKETYVDPQALLPLPLFAPRVHGCVCANARCVAGVHSLLSLPPSPLPPAQAEELKDRVQNPGKYGGGGGGGGGAAAAPAAAAKAAPAAAAKAPEPEPEEDMGFSLFD